MMRNSTLLFEFHVVLALDLFSIENLRSMGPFFFFLFSSIQTHIRNLVLSKKKFVEEMALSLSIHIHFSKIIG